MMGFFQTWMNVFLHKTKPSDIAKTELVEGLKHIAVAGAIVGLLSGILKFLASGKPGAELVGSASIAGVGEADPFLIVASLIFTPIASVIGILIGGAILWVLAKIVGGKGSYANYTGSLALLSASFSGTAAVALTIINILGALVGALLTVVGITAIIGLLGYFYQLYFTVRVTQAVHKVSILKAVVAVVVIPSIIGIILVMLLVAALLLGAAILIPSGSDILGALAGALLVVGITAIIGLLGYLYQLYLTARATQAVDKTSTLKAAVVVVIPLIIGIILVMLLVAALLL